MDPRGVFGPEELARMKAAYQAAHAGLTKAAVPFDPEALARAVIDLAEIGELDEGRIANRACQTWCDESSKSLVKQGN